MYIASSNISSTPRIFEERLVVGAVAFLNSSIVFFLTIDEGKNLSTTLRGCSESIAGFVDEDFTMYLFIYI